MRGTERCCGATETFWTLTRCPEEERVHPVRMQVAFGKNSRVKRVQEEPKGVQGAFDGVQRKDGLSHWRSNMIYCCHDNEPEIGQEKTQVHKVLLAWNQ